MMVDCAMFLVGADALTERPTCKSSLFIFASIAVLARDDVCV